MQEINQPNIFCVARDFSGISRHEILAVPAAVRVLSTTSAIRRHTKQTTKICQACEINNTATMASKLATCLLPNNRPPNPITKSRMPSRKTSQNLPCLQTLVVTKANHKGYDASALLSCARLSRYRKMLFCIFQSGRLTTELAMISSIFCLLQDLQYKHILTAVELKYSLRKIFPKKIMLLGKGKRLQIKFDFTNHILVPNILDRQRFLKSVLVSSFGNWVRV